MRTIKTTKSAQGFTLVELVVVMVVLGILAAVAIPRFIGVDDEARAAAIDGIAGAMASGASINFAASKVKAATDYTAVGTDTNCADLFGSNKPFGPQPTGYTTSGTVGADGEWVGSCTLAMTGTALTRSVTVMKTTTGKEP